MKKDKTRPGTDEIGIWGEKRAERFLKREGHRILGRRVRVGDRDEIDLITRFEKIVVFVEVKTRKSEVFGRPASAVDGNKRRLLSRAAVRYMKTKKFPIIHFRFDVVEVIGSVGDRDPKIRHIENAFILDPKYTLPF